MAFPMRRALALAILQSRRQELALLGIDSLALFGSTARDEAMADSDVDLLVAFHAPPSFLTYMEAKATLEAWLGARVDLVTEAGLLARVRPKVLAEAIRVA